MARKVEGVQIFRLLLAFFLATLVFVGIFVFSNTISYMNYQSSVKQNNAILESVLDLEKANNNFTCGGNFIFETSEKLDKVAFQMTLLESRWGKFDLRVIEQKKSYSELQYRHLKIIENLNNNCNTDFSIFLFFYSNAVELESASEKVSYILQAFKSKDAERIMVYSFDSGLDYKLINDLKDEFKVESVPSVVVGESGDVFLPSNIRDLDKYLD